MVTMYMYMLNVPQLILKPTSSENVTVILHVNLMCILALSIPIYFDYLSLCDLTCFISTSEKFYFLNLS